MFNLSNFISYFERTLFSKIPTNGSLRRFYQQKVPKLQDGQLKNRTSAPVTSFLATRWVFVNFEGKIPRQFANLQFTHWPKVVLLFSEVHQKETELLEISEWLLVYLANLVFHLGSSLMYTAWGKMPEHSTGTFTEKQTWQPSEHVSNIFEISSKKTQKILNSWETIQIPLYFTLFFESDVWYQFFFQLLNLSGYFFPSFIVPSTKNKRWNLALVDSKPLLEWPELKAREFYFFGPWHQMPRTLGVRSENFLRWMDVTD